jgi:hypothetical protein
MKIKTSELKDAFLDWAVGKCEYMRHSLESDFCGRVGYAWEYSTDWAQGGPIIEREGINIIQSGSWFAEMDADHSGGVIHAEGDTPLIAAMRCYVSSKLGDEVDVPEELQ